MKQIPGVVLAALALIGSLLMVRECSYRAGAKDAQARAVDSRNDSVAEVLKRVTDSVGRVSQRERDSTGREIARLRSQIPSSRRPEENGTKGDVGTSKAPTRPALLLGCAGAPAQCDTLIDALTAGRQQDSLQLLFWRGQVAQRDSLIPQLQHARDAWRARSERRLACVGGPTVTAAISGQIAYGLGIACGWRF